MDAEGRVRNAEAATRAVLQAYVPVLLKERTTSGRVSVVTRQLAAMEVGQVIRLRGASSSQTHAKMRSARLLMENPQAAWRTDSQSDGWLRVQRLPDGLKRTTAVTSHVTTTISKLPVNGSYLFDHMTKRSCFASGYKQVARRLMNDPHAQWSAKTTTKGVRVTRTA